MRDLAFRTSIPFVLVAVVLFVLGCGTAASPSGARDPNAVRVEASLGSPVLLANGDSTVYAVLRISTAARPASLREMRSSCSRGAGLGSVTGAGLWAYAAALPSGGVQRPRELLPSRRGERGLRHVRRSG